MLTSRCRQLRPLLTSYVDNELSDADRLLVEDHLKRCGSCRRRLARQNEVHQLLRRRTVEARIRGAAVPWSPRTFRPTDYRAGRALLSLSVLAVAAVVLGVVVWSRLAVEAERPLSARGQISDSACRGNHGRPGSERMTMSSRECLERCIEKGAQYVFVSEGVVYPIRNQQFADLARFAEQDIELEGRVQHSQLTVSRIRPLNLSYRRGVALSGGLLAEAFSRAR
ncbi:MAG: hypothetical protein DMF89_27175 [Acidobacteria bacterium]|nr:MAG: hypothetical protein DMF89_27175 [Acidobacteriota bacterium]